MCKDNNVLPGSLGFTMYLNVKETRLRLKVRSCLVCACLPWLHKKLPLEGNIMCYDFLVWAILLHTMWLHPVALAEPILTQHLAKAIGQAAHQVVIGYLGLLRCCAYPVSSSHKPVIHPPKGYHNCTFILYRKQCKNEGMQIYYPQYQEETIIPIQK